MNLWGLLSSREWVPSLVLGSLPAGSDPLQGTTPLDSIPDFWIPPPWMTWVVKGLTNQVLLRELIGRATEVVGGLLVGLLRWVFLTGSSRSYSYDRRSLWTVWDSLSSQLHPRVVQMGLGFSPYGLRGENQRCDPPSVGGSYHLRPRIVLVPGYSSPLRSHHVAHSGPV